MPQTSYKFDSKFLDEFGITRTVVTERGKEDWVAFLWSKHGQEAIGRGENLFAALDNAVSYLTNTFRLPPSMLKASLKKEPFMTSQSSIHRNHNNRILSPAEHLLQRFVDRKSEMEVTLPNEDLDEVKKNKNVVLPFGYDDIQGGYQEITVAPSSIQSLRENFDNMPAQDYSGSKRYLMWIKTIAGRVKELSPLDAHRGPIVATATDGQNVFYYFRVNQINRDLTVVDAKEPIIINFSRHENFQVHLYGLDPTVSFPSHIPTGTHPWSTVDLTE